MASDTPAKQSEQRKRRSHHSPKVKVGRGNKRKHPVKAAG
jgi:hypothetical protein